MTAIFRVVLLATLAVSCTPAVTTRQDVSTEGLPGRIDLLERRASELEQRVRELEALLAGEPTGNRSVAVSPKWQNLANWRQLRRGMTMAEVRALLGEPERVNASMAMTYWYWPDAGHLSFDGRSGRLESWSEPMR